jgi:twitching motility protein PilI
MAEATVSEAPGGVTDLEAAATAGSRLGVAIGADCWLIELSQAGEVLPVPEAIAVVPGARSWFKGLANLRGTLHGVIDLSEFRCGVPTERGKDARLLAFSPRLPVNGSILVTRMMGLQNMSRMQTLDDSTADEWAGACWQDGNGTQWRELHLDRLCRDESFLSAGR